MKEGPVPSNWRSMVRDANVLVSPNTAHQLQGTVLQNLIPVPDVPCDVEALASRAEKNIEDMTLDDYRRGVAEVLRNTHAGMVVV